MLSRLFAFCCNCTNWQTNNKQGWTPPALSPLLFVMANFSTAFGYDVYIIPLAASSVDVAFTGITEADAASGGFIDTTTTVLPGDTVSYAAGVFTVEGTAFDMDGLDLPVRLAGLTNAALQTDTTSEDIVTYDDDTKGFNLSLPTSKTWSITLAGVADFKDAGYHVLRLTEQNTVADALRVKFVRIGPTGTAEAIYGYGVLNGYTESVDAGSIVSWEATVQGYGPYRIDIDANA
jgi:hypothetical protein